MLANDLKSEFTLSLLFTPEKNEVLLQCKNRGPYVGSWNGVGGHVKEGEDRFLSALREIEEETSAALKSVCYVCTVQFHNGVVLHVYCATVSKDCVKQIEDEELRWFRVSEVLTSLNAGTTLCNGNSLAGDGNLPWLISESLGVLGDL